LYAHHDNRGQRAAHMARRGKDFGVNTGEISVDFAKVMERQNKMRHGTSEGMEKWLRGLDNVDVYDDFGTFAGPHTVRAGDELIAGETIVTNAIARSRAVPIPGLADVNWLDNRRILQLPELPRRLVITGGSYIGKRCGSDPGHRVCRPQ
jgi:pyruvate/2-oxoglutarate dehydrogenase complex dihydrolipoamide dehydrogenase (E3) component